MRPLFFIPGVRGANPEHFVSAGIGELLEEGSPQFADCMQGPGGHRGMMASFPTHDGKQDLPMGFDPNLEWIESEENAGAWWLGFDRDRRPAGEHLPRRVQFSGTVLPMADDQFWLIPDFHNLPKQARMRGGQVTFVYPPKFQEFVRRCDAVLSDIENEILREAMTGEYAPDDLLPKVKMEEGAWIAYEALRINHHLNYEMIDMLGLLDSFTILRIILVTIGQHALQADILEKKRAELSQAGATSTV